MVQINDKLLIIEIDHLDLIQLCFSLYTVTYTLGFGVLSLFPNSVCQENNFAGGQMVVMADNLYYFCFACIPGWQNETEFESLFATSTRKKAKPLLVWR